MGQTACPTVAHGGIKASKLAAPADKRQVRLILNRIVGRPNIKKLSSRAVEQRHNEAYSAEVKRDVGRSRTTSHTAISTWLLGLLAAGYWMCSDIHGMQVMVDFHACRWPSSIPTSHDTSIAEYFDNLNEPALSNLAENLEMEEENTGMRTPLITFSHFLPLQVLPV